jgi:Domain of unknown function (DUF4376)
MTRYAAVRPDGSIQFVCEGPCGPPDTPEFLFIEVDDAFDAANHYYANGGMVIGQLDTRTLQNVKDDKWWAIKQSRTAAEYAGFTWDGSKFDSDQLSQARITGAVSLAMMSPTFSIVWTLFDNTTRILNQTDMLQVGGALGTHVATQFAIGVSLREQINAAITKEEVEAVVWPNI